MKTLMSSAMILGLATAGVESAGALNIGDSMPALEKSIADLKGTDGKTYRLADLKGTKGTLVIFSCNECPYVKGWEERVSAIGKEFKNEFAIIQINSNDDQANSDENLEAMNRRAKARDFIFPYVQDTTSKVAVAFGATRTPEFFLFNAQGKLVYKGAMDDNYKDASKVKKNSLRDAMTALAKGQPIQTAETKSIGCTIKFRPGAKKES